MEALDRREWPGTDTDSSAQSGDTRADTGSAEARFALPRHRVNASRTASRMAVLPALFGPMNTVVSLRIVLLAQILQRVVDLLKQGANRVKIAHPRTRRSQSFIAPPCGCRALA